MDWIKQLKKYFEETPREKILEDWRKTIGTSKESVYIEDKSESLDICSCVELFEIYYDKNGVLIIKPRICDIPDNYIERLSFVISNLFKSRSMVVLDLINKNGENDRFYKFEIIDGKISYKTALKFTPCL